MKCTQAELLVGDDLLDKKTSCVNKDQTANFGQCVFGKTQMLWDVSVVWIDDTNRLDCAAIWERHISIIKIQIRSDPSRNWLCYFYLIL